MTIIKRIYKYLLPYKSRLIAGIIAMLFHAFFTVFFIKVFQDLIETIISQITVSEDGLRTLTWIALSLIVVFFLKGLSYYGQSYLIAFVSQKAIRDIRSDLYAHLQSLSLSFYSKRKTGEIISRVTNDVAQLQNAIVNGAISIFYESFTFIAAIIYLLYLNPRLTLFLIIILPVMTYVFRSFNQKLRKVSKRVQIKIADISDVLQETLAAVRVVKSFGREDYEFARFNTENEANFRAKVKNSQYGAILTPTVQFIAAISFTIILWYGGYEVIHGRMRPAELIAFFTLLLALSSPLKSLSRLTSTMQQALAAGERIFETMDINNHIIKEKPQAKVLAKVEGRVEFKDITFSYKQNEKVLEAINLKANPGQTVALVGPSGAGKTTLVDLIPRFYDPLKGQVLIDGIDIKDLNLVSLRSYIGIVPQETILFSGTIRSNIAYGNLEAGEKEIIKAAQAANAHDFIENFSHGYDTLVGERGVGLSGGQKQRIAIARAILKDPKILILDEATSALDSESESLVQEALNRLMKNRTTFVIAHRLTTIKNADTIIVLSQGKIIEKGNHQQLLAKKGLYYNLYQGQYQEKQLVGD